MRKMILIVALLLVSGPAAAKESRVERVMPTSAADDSKPNSDAVPAVYAIDTQFQRVVIVRLKYQTDLLEGLQSLVKKNNIRNAVILSGIGSVRGYSVHAVNNRTFPSKDTFVKDPEAPADLVGMNGYVVDGRVHAHVTLANPDKAFGGHLEPGTEVFAFAMVTLGILDDKTDLGRVDDKTYR